MPETTILNETYTWDDEIQDSLSPDYGFSKERPSTLAVTKPAGGRPWSQETSNAGHVFSLSWISRSYKCVQRIKQFYEQHKKGYFTIIDHDGGGRHYVGNFTAPPKIVQQGNDKYDIQGLAFEEIPGVPMLEYPDDWDNDAVNLAAMNDYGDVMVSVAGTWAQRVQVSEEGIQSTILYNDGTSPGDFATYEYRGYGFRLSMVQGPDAGEVQVLLDGVDLGTVDLYRPNDMGPQVIMERGAVSLDLHRLKVLVLGTKNGAATAASATWCMLTVMQ